VARFITDNFIPARVHVREQAADFKRFGDRYGAHWTPTILELDSRGVEQHRIEGFLPAEEFLAQLALGVGHAAFKRQDWDEAERRFRAVVSDHPSADAAPEAAYWAGVARYKASHDAKVLTETADELARRFGDTIWARKASIWARKTA
jgi:TolA-binding protein